MDEKAEAPKFKVGDRVKVTDKSSAFFSAQGAVTQVYCDLPPVSEDATIPRPPTMMVTSPACCGCCYQVTKDDETAFHAWEGQLELATSPLKGAEGTGPYKENPPKSKPGKTDSPKAS